jgi:hypothetical protein
MQIWGLMFTRKVQPRWGRMFIVLTYFDKYATPSGPYMSVFD